MEGICIYGSCPHGEDEEGAKNMMQGCIQLVSKLGMNEGMSAAAMEHIKKHQSMI